MSKSEEIKIYSFNKSKEMRIYSLSQDSAIKSAKKILSNEGKKNIKILSAIPQQLDGDKGYVINVSYEDDLENNITDLQKLKKTRLEAINIKNELNKVYERHNKLMDKLATIQKNCNHNIVVKLKKICNERIYYISVFICLNCNITYRTVFDENVPFENIIHLEDFKQGEDITDKEKLEIALQLLEQKRIENPTLSDKEIVKMINEEISIMNQKTKIIKRG